MANTSKEWIRPEIQDLVAYHVHNPGQLIKLDNMENPYVWDDLTQGAWLERLKSASLNRYPDAANTTLVRALREAFAIPDEFAVLLGNGSDELIQMICMALAKPGSTVLSPVPSFVMYKMIALFTGMQHQSVQLNSDFSLPLQAMLAAMKKHQPAVVFLSYPNNPTGNLFDEEAVCQIVENAPGLVVLDEAYFSFAGKSFISLLENYSNLIILRTISKMGLAGLRLGYMIGHPDWINEINKVRLPFNINCLTQVSAEFALAHGEVFKAQAQQICEDREKLFSNLQAIDKICCFSSAANFILFKTAVGEADRIYMALKDAGVLIRNLHPQGGLLTDCLRVTVGKPEENDAFLNALQEIV